VVVSKVGEAAPLMTRRHLVFLVVEQCIGAALFNIALNAGIAWLAFRNLTQVPLWGAQSIVLDTIITCFMLPFMTCLISTAVIRWQVHNEKLPHMLWRRLKHRTLGRLPHGTFRRALALGVIGITIAVPTVFLLAIAGADPLSFEQFVVFKALYAALLASFFSPVIALCVLGDIPPKVVSARA
jgi:hypothetical protein